MDSAKRSVGVAGETQLLNAEPARSYAVVTHVGDEPVSCVARLARGKHLDAARLTAIGAFSRVGDADRRSHFRRPAIRCAED